MPLIDIFKKKKEKDKIPAVKIKEKKTKDVDSEIKVKEKTIGAKEKLLYAGTPFVLKCPHITEKATDLAGKNQYSFKVWPQVNKIEIKKAIKELYDVDVLKVRIVKIPRKSRRMGRQKGWRPGFIKAIVKIKEGQKIEVLPR